MITISNAKMVPGLKALWKEAFGDEDAYVDFFFANKYKHYETYVYLYSELPVSMAFVFDAELFIDNAYMPIKYIYGVATAKEYRRQGLSTQILEHIKAKYPSSFLVPSTENLFCFYKRNGYKNAFVLEELHFDALDAFNPSTKLIFQDITPMEYKEIRDEYFMCNGYIRWDEEMIAYALAENALCGGSTLRVKSADSDETHGILLYRCYQNQLFIKETTLADQILQDVVFCLMKETGSLSCNVRLKAKDKKSGKHFGMLYHSSELENGYCNLVLD